MSENIEKMPIKLNENQWGPPLQYQNIFSYTISQRQRKYIFKLERLKPDNVCHFCYGTQFIIYQNQIG